MPGMKSMSLREIRRERGEWRSDVFMHQLSENGSLLLYQNHDKLWIEIYWMITGRQGSGWTREAQILRYVPAGAVRQLLWRTSYLWWEAVLASREDLARFCFRQGILEEDRLLRLDHKLQRTSLQLGDLAWCASDQDRNRIETIG